MQQLRLQSNAPFTTKTSDPPGIRFRSSLHSTDVIVAEISFQEELTVAVVGAAVGGIIAAGGSGVAVLKGMATAQHRRDRRVEMLERLEEAFQESGFDPSETLRRGEGVTVLTNSDGREAAEIVGWSRFAARMALLKKTARQSSGRDLRVASRASLVNIDTGIAGDVIELSHRQCTKVIRSALRLRRYLERRLRSPNPVTLPWVWGRDLLAAERILKAMKTATSKRHDP